MADALGVGDRDAMHGILRQLVKASVNGRKPDPVNLAFMLAMVEGTRPRDAIEAMLVAQMVSVHVTAKATRPSPRMRGRRRSAGERRAHPGPAGPHLSGADRGAQPLSQQRRARRHRAERVGAGWRQRHRRQRHAACERDRLGRGRGAAESTGLSNPAPDINPMMVSRRCGAKTRAGGSCRAPAMRGKRRCRMHGGAPGSGAPRGNRNARRHGVFTGTRSPSASGSGRCWMRRGSI